MFGCWSRAAASASRRKRATKSSSSARCSASSLTATGRSSTSSVARNTVDMPPAPRRRSARSGQRPAVAYSSSLTPLRLSPVLLLAGRRAAVAGVVGRPPFPRPGSSGGVVSGGVVSAGSSPRGGGLRGGRLGVVVSASSSPRRCLGRRLLLLLGRCSRPPPGRADARRRRDRLARVSETLDRAGVRRPLERQDRRFEQRHAAALGRLALRVFEPAVQRSGLARRDRLAIIAAQAASASAASAAARSVAKRVTGRGTGGRTGPAAGRPVESPVPLRRSGTPRGATPLSTNPGRAAAMPRADRRRAAGRRRPG